MTFNDHQKKKTMCQKLFYIDLLFIKKKISHQKRCESTCCQEITINCILDVIGGSSCLQNEADLLLTVIKTITGDKTDKTDSKKQKLVSSNQKRRTQLANFSRETDQRNESPWCGLFRNQKRAIYPKRRGKIKPWFPVWELMQSTFQWNIWGNKKVTQIYI